MATQQKTSVTAGALRVRRPSTNLGAAGALQRLTRERPVVVAMERNVVVVSRAPRQEEQGDGAGRPSFGGRRQAVASSNAKPGLAAWRGQRVVRHEDQRQLSTCARMSEAAAARSWSWRSASAAASGGKPRPNPSLESGLSTAGRLGRVALRWHDAPRGPGVLPRPSAQLER